MLKSGSQSYWAWSNQEDLRLVLIPVLAAGHILEHVGSGNPSKGRRWYGDPTIYFALETLLKAEQLHSVSNPYGPVFSNVDDLVYAVATHGIDDYVSRRHEEDNCP